MDPDTFAEAIQAISQSWWDINYTEFCRRADWREDEYSESKWQQWQALNRALQAFDPATLARISGLVVLRL